MNEKVRVENIWKHKEMKVVNINEETKKLKNKISSVRCILFHGTLVPWLALVITIHYFVRPTFHI